MKYDVFFKLAKEAGIESCELYVSHSYSFSVSLFRGEIDKYSLEDSSSYIARGIINGKFGTATSDVFDNKKAKFLVDSIVHNAKIVESKDPAILFRGSKRYKKINNYNKELDTIALNDKISKLYELEKAINSLDKRIDGNSTETGFDESRSSISLYNSYGLKLEQKNNYFVYYGSALAKENQQVKSGWELFLDNDFNKFDVEKLAKKVVENTTSQLNGNSIKSKSYKAVLDHKVVASLIGALIGHADAENVQKHSSLFIDKLNSKILSNKLTVEERPLDKSLFSRYFDDEGVATYNKSIIKKGVLQTYLYHLTSAAKDNVESTGNGYKEGAKIGASFVNLTIKPGKKSLEELFKKEKTGVYITSVGGLHAGLNAQSGNFSLQAEGFYVLDGKIDKPLDLITISGNLLEVFNDIVEVGSDLTMHLSSISNPSILIKKIKVGSK